ncbi:cysteine-rich repeat secretory protein 38-like [Beta vulgaris subsp. vulgaris]|uniref:cysteine-rich repeat secretory protein 38-like n=1 Tax=Beta vulgaris subsp. vulgaris TaxID=3555 RepID=UPI002036DAE3|nr:cysteine-rich repeat secretory protein 38-like [Beta vulgaris subsp. vulgaris]
MSFTNIFLISCIFFLQTTIIAANNPLSYSCINSQNFTTGSHYELNLNKLTGLLVYLTQPTGYAQATVGQAHGLGLCRGDVSSFDCLSCISEAGIQARKLCPGNKGAVIWYDHCMFKYLDQNFFGQIDQSVAVSLLNVNNVTNNQMLFIQKNNELLGKLSEEASVDTKRYASGEIIVDGNTTIYGLAQCTKDLSSYNCKKCLDYQITSNLPNCCEGKRGGRVLVGSCNVRYEVYPFVKL